MCSQIRISDSIPPVCYTRTSAGPGHPPGSCAFLFMASEKQIAANRLNSQHSTGPRTEAGKSVSRMNALQSGLHAESHIIRGEAPEALAQLTAEYYAEWNPVTPRQRDLVDTVIHNQWLIRRLRLTEADLYAHHYQRRDDDFDEQRRYKVLQRKHHFADAFNSLEKLLLRLQSRLNSLERSNRAALKELRDLQSGAGASACQPAEGPQLVAIEAESSDIGFVPSSAETEPSADPAPHTLVPQPPHPESPIGFVPQ